MAEHNIDPVTGRSTTGHEWDGLRELNTPLPRWWLWLFYLTIIWAVGYWIVYPAWPLVTSYTSGLFQWNSRTAVVEDIAALKASRSGMETRIAAATLEQIAGDQQLLAFARAQGRAAFVENCAGCHGSGGGGAKGYPNLNDDDWIWSGKLEEIAQTIRHGVRSNSEKTRMGPAMPAFGRDGMIPGADIEEVADYVRSLSGLPAGPKANLTRGAKVYADNCAVCHKPDGSGDRSAGAPNLRDKIWLYGSDRASIIEGLVNGRGGMMPAWAERLDDTTIKSLTVYVHSLGGGEK
jgi:cytochrome c oxidase cbb3-type subunit 3